MTGQREEIAALLHQFQQIEATAEEIQNRATSIIATGKASRPMMEALANLHMSINQMAFEARQIIELTDGEP